MVILAHKLNKLKAAEVETNGSSLAPVTLNNRFCMHRKSLINWPLSKGYFGSRDAFSGRGQFYEEAVVEKFKRE